MAYCPSISHWKHHGIPKQPNVTLFKIWTLLFTKSGFLPGSHNATLSALLFNLLVQHLSYIIAGFLLRCFFSLLLLAGGDFAIGDGASPKGVTAVLELQMVVLSGQLLRTGSRTVIWEVCWTSYRDLQWSSRLCNGGTLRFDVMLVLSEAFCCSWR